MEYLRQELGVPDDAEEKSVDSRFDNVDGFEALEFEGDDYTTAYIEVEDFRNKLGFTLDEVTEWLDTRYETDFGSVEIDDFEYGNDWIILRRQKTGE